MLPQKPMVTGVACDARRGQQLRQRGDEHQRIDERVHAVERPPAVGGQEPALLVRREHAACRLRLAVAVIAMM